MADINFMSYIEACIKGNINPIVGRVPNMFYDPDTGKIFIVHCIGAPEYMVFLMLCHEILHSALHRAENLETCWALDRLPDGNIVDGKLRWIWVGEEWDESNF